MSFFFYKCGSCGKIYTNKAGEVLRCRFCQSKDRELIGEKGENSARHFFEELINKDILQSEIEIRSSEDENT